MKNLKSLIITLMLLLAASTNAGAQQHLKFMGIPLTGTIDQFQSKLAAKGIYKDKLSSTLQVGIRAYNGFFTGRKCMIYVYYDTKRGKTVYRAKAVYSNEEEEIADKYYADIKQMLQSKYALEESGSDTDSNGYPVFRVYPTTDKGTYLGEIDLYKNKISNYLFTTYSIHVDYIDGANYSKQQNSNMDDL